MSRTKGGTFVAIEGIDAVGKSTQSSTLNAWLTSKKLSSQTLSFPDYSTVIGREIKKFLVGEKDYPQEVRAMLYAANRWENKPRLEQVIFEHDVTIVNRYTGSNLAYGLSNGLSLEWLLSLELGLPQPDLVIVLDASPQLLMPRRGVNKDTYERNLGLQTRARDSYLELSRRFGWKVLDASAGIEETGRLVTGAVAEVLAARGRTV
ncbi:MAG TPA: dTMP kinase [Nitrososphaerales archaeon]|nr:dTMP kinase [Nitrososphaerales archaeon]